MTQATTSQRPITPSDVIDNVDVAEIAARVYDFLSSTRRLMERPNQQLNISQSEIEVLQYISMHPGCGVTDIARRRFLRASNVSATTRRLINNGLVKRSTSRSDRRAQELKLTPDGAHMMDQITQEWAKIIAQATNLMEPRDVLKLRRGVSALDKLSEASEVLIDGLQRNAD